MNTAAIKPVASTNVEFYIKTRMEYQEALRELNVSRSGALEFNRGMDRFTTESPAVALADAEDFFSAIETRIATAKALREQLIALVNLGVDTETAQYEDELFDYYHSARRAQSN